MPLYLNFHTHRLTLEGEITLPSFGLHPWHLAEQLQNLPSPNLGKKKTLPSPTLGKKTLPSPSPGKKALPSPSPGKKTLPSPSLVGREWSPIEIEESLYCHIQSAFPQPLGTSRRSTHQEGESEREPGAFWLIGECGLDRLCDTPYPLQLAAFEAQISLSERLRRPLVLHCVRAVDDVLRLHRSTTQPWVWHGFRGKPQQMQQLLQHGFYLSFGFHFNAESLCTCPAERLFLETDDDPRPVADLYATAADLRHTTPATLNQQCWDNLMSMHNV